MYVFTLYYVLIDYQMFGLLWFYLETFFHLTLMQHVKSHKQLKLFFINVVSILL